jgi:hypothetical protein
MRGGQHDTVFRRAGGKNQYIGDLFDKIGARLVSGIVYLYRNMLILNKGNFIFIRDFSFGFKSCRLLTLSILITGWLGGQQVFWSVWQESLEIR